MTDDRAMFAMGLPGGVRSEERAEASDAYDAPPIEVDTSPDTTFDSAVFQILSAAKTAEEQAHGATKTGAEEDSAGEAGNEDITALSRDQGELSGPVLPRIASQPQKARGHTLSSAALGSLLFHVAVFAMALQVAKAVPDAPMEEGGVTVSVVMLGNGDVDAAAAGEDTIANPVEVSAEPVPVEETPVVEAEPLTAEQAPQAAVPVPLETVAPAEPVETAPTPVEALASPEPEVLAVAPTSDTPPPDAVVPQAIAPVEAAPAETAVAQAISPTAPDSVPPEMLEAAPPEASEPPLQAATAPTETITAQEDDPELAYDIAPPVPAPSPWREEPLPQDQVEARQQQEREQQQRRTAQRQRSSGSAGQSNRDARRGSATGTASAGTQQAAQANAGSQGNGRAEMDNYKGRVGRKISRAVAAERYYRGHGPLDATVTIHVTLNRSGSISKVFVARSSGNSAVDSIAVQRARSAGPFGAFPTAYSGSSVTFVQPVRLRLRR